MLHTISSLSMVCTEAPSWNTHVLLHSWTIDTGFWMLSLEVVKTTLLSSTRGQSYSFSKGCPPANSSELNPWTKQCTTPLDVLNTPSKIPYCVYKCKKCYNEEHIISTCTSAFDVASWMYSPQLAVEKSRVITAL